MRRLVIALTLTLALATPSAGLATSASATGSGQTTHAALVQTKAKHKCTKTSSGTCIKKGQFCPKAKKGKYGWDANGRKLKCKGKGSHPHWRAA